MATTPAPTLPSTARPNALPVRVAVVLLVALVARVVWGVAVPAVPLFDSYMYDLLARNIAAGIGYHWRPGVPTAYWPVGTSFLYSILYRVFGVGYGPIVALNVVLGVGIIALTMVLARRWFGPTVAAWAGAVLAVWPSQIQFTTVLASELPFNALVLAAGVAFPTDQSRWLARSVLAGFLLAGASYIRPLALLLPLIFALPEAVSDRRLLAPALKAGLALAVLIACLLPWMMRNHRLLGEYVLISTNGGVNTWMGNNPETTGFFQLPPAELDGLSETERDRRFSAEASAFIRRRPLQFVGRSLVKAVRTHERESIGIIWNEEGLARRLSPRGIFALKLLSNAYWWLMLGLGLGGIVLLLRERGLLPTALHPAVLYWGYFAAVHGVTVAGDRYHFASIPFIAILGATVLARVRTRPASAA
jgi:hypothetical protein